MGETTDGDGVLAGGILRQTVHGHDIDLTADAAQYYGHMVDCVLSPLKLTTEETDGVKQALEKMVRDRAADRHTATLTNPINIGIGKK